MAAFCARAQIEISVAVYVSSSVTLLGRSLPFFRQRITAAPPPMFFARKADTRPNVVAGRLFSAAVCRIAGSQRGRRSWGLFPCAGRVFPEPCAVGTLTRGFRLLVF